MPEYDKAKADKLFSAHIKPAVVLPGDYARMFDTVLLEDHGEIVTHYVITPELLGEIFHHLRCYRDGVNGADIGEHIIVTALVGHLLTQPSLPVSGGLKWERAIQPDPKPAWRIAADEAKDKGLDFTGVLDVIEKALATEAGK